MSKHKPEVDCTKWCRSRKHGQVLTSAITKRSISDKALASFIKGTCANFIKAFDCEGRTALHMAASRGRVELMQWLVRHSSVAFINARDRESGYTPLHRAIFYGQINAAVKLIIIGVNTDVVDKDDYTAIDHALLDRSYMYKLDNTQPCDAYVWGTNSNYTLGTGSNQPKTWADSLSTFSRNNINVTQACLGKFHSVWVCSSSHEGPGVVYCCGQLARAGGPHCTALRPTPLRLPEPCVCVAITLTSTVMLLESGTVFQYCLNSNDNVSQSSTKTPSFVKLPSIKPLMKLSSPIGVRAAKSHAIVWNRNAVYTWGTNVGQLGHPEADKIIATPKRVMIPMNVKEDVTLQLVEASDAASVVTTSRGDVYLLHKFICKKIAIKQINLRQIAVYGKVSDHGAYSKVTVLLLTNVGQLKIWQDTTNKVTRCVFGLAHQVLITHMALFQDAVYFTTTHGEAYIGSIHHKSTPPATQQPIRKEKEKDGKSALVKFLEKDDCTSVRIVKIRYIYRAVAIAVDSEGLNFACLQTKATCGLTSLPELSTSCMTKHMDTLRETANEDDLLHDVIFQVAHRRFPAHMFIIASSSEHLYKLYQDHITSPGEKPTILIENVHPEAFERVLKFIYTGTCDVIETGNCALKIRKEDLVKKEREDVEMEEIKNPSEISAFEVYNNKKNNKKSRISAEQRTRVRVHVYVDPVKLVQATAKRLQVMQLHKLLDNFFYRDGVILLKESANITKTPPIHWDRESFPGLVDTNVCSKDGQLIPAHKCVLAARLEYFNGMFMHSWTESKMLSTVTLPINYNILLPAINFLYTDSCPEIENTGDYDFIAKILVVADQLFISRLKEMCEIALANLLSLKIYPELCQLAHVYNANQLKQCCMEFICLNLPTILESRGLDLLDDDLKDDITKYYCKLNPIMSSRVITPFYNATDDNIIEELAKQYPVDLNVIDEEVKKDDNLIEIQTNNKKKNKQSKKVEYTDSEKQRMRYESVSSVNSLDLSNEKSGDISLSLSKLKDEKGSKDKQEKWVEVPTSLQKQQKVVQARLKAIESAKDILNETPVESFTKLTKNSSAISINSPENASTSRMSVSPNDSPIENIRSPQGNMVISHIGPKLSQKQRKKLAMQGEQSQQNLNDYFNKLTVESPPEKPKNPWKICEPPAASSSPKSKALEFNQILTDQKKQKEDFSRIMTKSLAMTQLEDKAIEQLERFYNANDIDDEYITVRRIELQVSSPQWLHTASK